MLAVAPLSRPSVNMRVATRLYPVENFAGFVYPKDVTGYIHQHRWLDAIVAGTKTSAGFDYAGPLTETVQLGNVATRMARTQ